MTCSNWEMSAFTGHRSRSCLTSSLTFSPISRLSMIRRSSSRSPRSSTCGRKVWRRENAEQLPNQARGPVGVLLDLHDVLEGRIGRLVRVEQEVGRHHDGGQHVVEVVRDAAGELADRFHPSALIDLVLQRALAGGLEHIDDRGLGVAVLLLDRRNVEAPVALAAAAQAGVDRRDLALSGGGLADRAFQAARGRARTQRRGSSGRRPAPPGNMRANSALVREIFPALSTVAIAIGVDWKKRMKRTSAVRCGSVGLAAGAVEHQRPRGARHAVGAERDLVEQPHRHRAPAAGLEVDVHHLGLHLAGAAASVVISEAPLPETMSASFSPPEPTCARSWSSHEASVALR